MSAFFTAIGKNYRFENTSSFAHLEPAYAGVRYPDAPEVSASEGEVEQSLDLARKVLKWSKSQMK